LLPQKEDNLIPQDDEETKEEPQFPTGMRNETEKEDDQIPQQHTNVHPQVRRREQYEKKLSENLEDVNDDDHLDHESEPEEEESEHADKEERNITDRSAGPTTSGNESEKYHIYDPNIAKEKKKKAAEKKKRKKDQILREENKKPTTNSPAVTEKISTNKNPTKVSK